MPSIIELDEQSLTAKLHDAQDFVLLDLWAPWCAPCRTLAPILGQLAQAVGPGLEITKLDVERYPQVMTSFGVRGIPTLLLFKGGAEVGRSVGVKPLPKLNDWLRESGVPLEVLSASQPLVKPGYPAFYGDASLKEFLWRRVQEHARCGELEGGVQAFWSEGRGTVSGALVHSAEAEIFERLTGLRAAFASTLDLVEPLTPAALAELGAAIQPGADLDAIPLRLIEAFLGEPAFDWPGLLQSAAALDELRRECLAGCQALLAGEPFPAAERAPRIEAFAEHQDVPVQLTAALLAALTPVPAVDDGQGWALVHLRASRLAFVLGRHARHWSLAEQNMERVRYLWFTAHERELPGGAFTEPTLELARAQWTRENAAYQNKEDAYLQSRGWEAISSWLRERLIALLHARPRGSSRS